jgi:hypothetical protein
MSEIIYLKDILSIKLGGKKDKKNSINPLKLKQSRHKKTIKSSLMERKKHKKS